VLLATSDLEHASEVAGKLLRSLERPFLLEGQSLHVGASIGIALFPEHGKDAMTLMRQADVAMYVAKRNTRGFAIYDPATDEHNPRNLALLGELRTAIDLDELVLYFQPKVDLKVGRIAGVEALVRWQHPRHGLMFPDEFVPLAEQTGLIKPLTMWVLKDALRQHALWRQAGIDLEIAVNLSVRNLQDARLPERVAKILEGVSKPNDRLWLEITETDIMADPERAHAVLANLDDMNVMLSIDDFGTGYSSLAYLRQLPVREIKIDKSFVMAMHGSENDAVIVHSIVDLAHNIGLQVIAEGIEDEPTYRRLLELGCDMGQGYYFSKPIPADEFLRWLSESRWGINRDVARGSVQS
jgi:EAL domain-containing protein (putative c-di-GMP-specific phosphodiesterase class I)